MTRIFPPLTSSSFSFDDNNQKNRVVLQETPAKLQPQPQAETPQQPASAALSPEPAGLPTDEDAQKAFQTLLKWIGEDINREGLQETPARVTRAWKEFFAGYKEDPKSHLAKTFPNTERYNEMVCLENIRLESYCEHHLVPITGTAFVAYIPDEKIAGLSKLARVVEGYSKRLQVQEKLTRQIAQALQDGLAPKGVAVAIRSEHQCLSTRGVYKPGSEMFTLATFGAFETDAQKRAEFLAIVNRAV